MTTAGASLVEGGAGNDRIRAFAGSNIILAGPGKDVVNAVNDALDQINCGPGKDKVLYDANQDLVKNCEDRRPQ